MKYKKSKFYWEIIKIIQKLLIIAILNYFET